jgi:hypothetical protein
MASVNLLLTPIKVSVGPPKEAPIILLLWGLAVYFFVGRCCFTAVSVAGLVQRKGIGDVAGIHCFFCPATNARYK